MSDPRMVWFAVPTSNGEALVRLDDLVAIEPGSGGGSMVWMHGGGAIPSTATPQEIIDRMTDALGTVAS